MGDSPPVCQNHIPYPSNITTIGYNKKLKHWNMLVLSEKALAHGASPIVVVPKKATPGEPPHRRMCIDFRKLNDLQPEGHLC